MSSDGEGKIYIDMVEFWKFVEQFTPKASGAEFVFGVPKFTPDGLEIKYAFSTECHPSEWATKPEALVELAEFKKNQGDK